MQDISREWGCDQLFLLVCVFFPQRGAHADSLLAIAAVHVFGLQVSYKVISFHLLCYVIVGIHYNSYKNKQKYCAGMQLKLSRSLTSTVITCGYY